MRLGLSSAAFYGRREVEDSAELLPGYGLDVCEVFLNSFSEYNTTFGGLVRERLNGLPCVSVHPKGTQFEPDIFSPSPRQRQDALDFFRRVCDAGQALGASYYVFHSVGMIRGRRHPGELYHMVENLHAMQEIAHPRGMEVLWENVSWCAMATLEDVRQVRELLPEQGFVLDLKQAYQVGVTPAEMIAAMGPHLKHLHVLDWNAAGELVLPGEGVNDFAALFRLLKKTSYQGAVILEPYAAQTRDDARLRASLTYLRQAMREAGV